MGLIEFLGKTGNSLSCRKTTSEELEQSIQPLLVSIENLAQVHPGGKGLIRKSERNHVRVVRHDMSSSSAFQTAQAGGKAGSGHGPFLRWRQFQYTPSSNCQ
jgi:hypothetical protein